MKRIFQTVLIAIAFISASTLTSCKKVCTAGYEGKNCKIEMRSKFVGIYKVSGTVSSNGSPSYFSNQLIEITSSASINSVLLSHPYLGSITATVSGTAMTAPDQITFTESYPGYPSGTTTHSISYEGTASINSNVLTLAGKQTEKYVNSISGMMNEDILTLNGTGVKQ